MSWRVVWTNNAISGLREMALFQDEIEPGRGAVLVDSIFDKMGLMVEFPESAPRHPRAEDPRIRRLVFGRYVLVYRVIKETRVLQVLAVRHHRQRSIKLDELP